MNFSYPSLEEPKPPAPPQPEPAVTCEAQEPSTPSMVNGVAPAEPPASITSMVAQKVADVVDSPVTNSTNSEVELSKKVPASGNTNLSPATAKALPQVLYATQTLLELKTVRIPMYLTFFSHLSLTVQRNPPSRCQMSRSPTRMDQRRIPPRMAQLFLTAQSSHLSLPTLLCLKKNKVRSTLKPWQ